MTDYDKIEQVKKIIQKLLDKYGIEVRVEFEDSITKGLIFNLTSPESYLLIGRQGANLHALQILVQALVAKKFPAANEPFHFIVDVDDYKRKREWFLKETAMTAMTQVKRTGRSVTLEPMPSYERRLIHAYLQEHNPEAYTESIGQEPNRRIVIRLKK